MGRSGRRVQSFKQFVVHDDACGMKVGTDALLLGSWAGSETARRGGQIRQALDIGTGSGILALMVGQRFPEATVQALELEPDAEPLLALRLLLRCSLGTVLGLLLLRNPYLDVWHGY